MKVYIKDLRRNYYSLSPSRFKYGEIVNLYFFEDRICV